MKKISALILVLALGLSLVLSLGSCSAPAPDSDLTLGNPGENGTPADGETKDTIANLSGAIADLVAAEALEPDTEPGTTGLKYRENAVIEGENRIVKSYTVADYDGTDTTVYIPYTYNDKPVIAIGYAAFEDAEITSITLPKTLVKIGQYAFRDCDKLTTLNIPALVTEISSDALLGTASLAAITVDDANQTFLDVENAIVLNDTNTLYLASNSTKTISSTISAIGVNAFRGRKLTEITIPNTVTTIGDGAFMECTSLTTVTFGTNLAKVPNYAFQNCTALNIETFPENITEIGDGAFTGCTAITSLTIPATVQKIGTAAFDGCSNITTLTLNEGLETIDAIAFRNCIRITEVVIPASLKTIGACAFFECSSLAKVVFSDNMKIDSVGDSAFYNCKALKQIYLPAAFANATLGTAVFLGCYTVDALGVKTHITVLIASNQPGKKWATDKDYGDTWDRCSANNNSKVFYDKVNAIYGQTRPNGY